jgi:hypothetical protein
MIEHIGSFVEVGTVEAIYAGRLAEVNEQEIHIESESGWVVIPLDRIAYVREKKDE